MARRRPVHPDPGPAHDYWRPVMMGMSLRVPQSVGFDIHRLARGVVPYAGESEQPSPHLQQAAFDAWRGDWDSLLALHDMLTEEHPHVLENWPSDALKTAHEYFTEPQFRVQEKRKAKGRRRRLARPRELQHRRDFIHPIYNFVFRGPGGRLAPAYDTLHILKELDRTHPDYEELKKEFPQLERARTLAIHGLHGDSMAIRALHDLLEEEPLPMKERMENMEATNATLRHLADRVDKVNEYLSGLSTPPSTSGHDLELFDLLKKYPLPNRADAGENPLSSGTSQLSIVQPSGQRRGHEYAPTDLRKGLNEEHELAPPPDVPTSHLLNLEQHQRVQRRPKQ